MSAHTQTTHDMASLRERKLLLLTPTYVLHAHSMPCFLKGIAAILQYKAVCCCPNNVLYCSRKQLRLACKIVRTAVVQRSSHTCLSAQRCAGTVHRTHDIRGNCNCTIQTQDTSLAVSLRQTQVYEFTNAITNSQYMSTYQCHSTRHT